MGVQQMINQYRMIRFILIILVIDIHLEILVLLSAMLVELSSSSFCEDAFPSLNTDAGGFVL